IAVAAVAAVVLAAGTAFALTSSGDPPAGDDRKEPPTAKAAPDPPKIPEKGGPIRALVVAYSQGKVVATLPFHEPAQIAALERCFPDYRKRPSSNENGGWKFGYEVYFNFPEGNTVRLTVSADRSRPGVWSVGRGDFPVAGDFYKLVAAAAGDPF